MRNRAKCKLCSSIIESFHRHDLVSCKCGEITIYGGEYEYACSAKNFHNFLRVDDEDHEIVVRFKDAEQLDMLEKSPPSKKELFEMLDAQIKAIEGLPTHAMAQPVTHYDLLSSLLLISAIFKATS